MESELEATSRWGNWEPETGKASRANSDRGGTDLSIQLPEEVANPDCWRISTFPGVDMTHHCTHSTRHAVLLAACCCMAACAEDGLCIQDDPFELVITARSSMTDEPLSGLSGYTRSSGFQNALHCVDGDRQVCYGQIAGSRGAVHLEREGYLPWDTTNVRIARTGGQCPRPIEKHLEAGMVPG